MPGAHNKIAQNVSGKQHNKDCGIVGAGLAPSTYKK